MAWTEWVKLSAEARAGRLKGKQVPADWKSLDLIIESETMPPLLHVRDYDNTGSQVDPKTKGLAYSLFRQKQGLAEEAPGWGGAGAGRLEEGPAGSGGGRAPLRGAGVPRHRRGHKLPSLRRGGHQPRGRGLAPAEDVLHDLLAVDRH